MQIHDSYIIQCRTNWFLGIRPADKSVKSTYDYQALIKIAQKYFDHGQYEEFAYNFMEGQYLIPLWTAHLILEYGQPATSLKDKCLQVVAAYIDNPLTPEIAIEEKNGWTITILRDEGQQPTLGLLP